MSNFSKYRIISPDGEVFEPFEAEGDVGACAFLCLFARCFGDDPKDYSLVRVVDEEV